MEITRQAATNLINSYCLDAPADEQTAIDAIIEFVQGYRLL